MRFVILTTQTIHHAYFISKLINHFKINLVILETPMFHGKKNLYHPFEKERDEYEKNIWFKNTDVTIENMTETFFTSSINDDNVYNKLCEINPDLIIDFGTRKLNKRLVNTFKSKLWNLHGGNPEKYRGLDSHLWAIYNNDFFELKTCLHKIDYTLDTGDIYKILPLSITKETEFHHLRCINTEVCLKLTIDMVREFKNQGYISCKKQTKNGEYFSHMNKEYKEMCKYNFEEFIKNK